MAQKKRLRRGELVRVGGDVLAVWAVDGQFVYLRASPYQHTDCRAFRVVRVKECTRIVGRAVEWADDA